MKRLCFATFALMSLFVPPAHGTEVDPEGRYQALLAAAKAGDQGVDWQALRFAHADRPSIQWARDGINPIRIKMTEASRSGNFAELLTQAQALIERNFIDAQAHVMAYYAYRALGRQDDAEREKSIAVGLFKSMETGDGLSPATAFTVVGIIEEYQLMKVAHARLVTNQALIHHDGHAYDVLETTGRDGNAVAYYFLVDRGLAAQRR